jgi:hypothetical protein
VDFEEDV